MPYMSVASGFFHKLYAGGADAVRNSEYYTPENLKIAEGLHGLMEEYQISLTQAVLGYLTCRDFTCLPLYGPRNIEDLKDAMGTFSIPFLKEYYPEADFFNNPYTKRDCDSLFLSHSLSFLCHIIGHFVFI